MIGRSLICVLCFVITTNFISESDSDEDKMRLRKRWSVYVGQSMPTQQNVIRFCGFVDGRFNVDTPQWWIKSLSDLVVGNEIRASKPEADMKVSMDAGRIVVESNGREIANLVNADLKFGQGGMVSSPAANSVDGNVYILDKTDEVGPYRIVRVDSGQNRTAWIVDVDTLPSNVVGDSNHETELRGTSKEIVVFGAVYPFAYITVIDVGTGEKVDEFMFRSKTDGAAPLFEKE